MGCQVFEDNMHVNLKSTYKKPIGCRILEIQNINMYSYICHVDLLLSWLNWTGIRWKKNLPAGSQNKYARRIDLDTKLFIFLWYKGKNREGVWGISFSLAACKEKQWDMARGIKRKITMAHNIKGNQQNNPTWAHREGGYYGKYTNYLFWTVQAFVSRDTQKQMEWEFTLHSTWI